jgi:integrase
MTPETEKQPRARRRSKGEGSLLLLKGCAIWYAQYYQDGRQIRVSTGKRSKMEAYTVLRDLLGKAERGERPITELKKTTYGQLRAGLIASYEDKGNRSLETREDGATTMVGLPPLDKFFGFSADKKSPSDGVPVTHITKDAVERFKKQRAEEGAGPAMINRSLAALRRMLRIAFEDNLINRVLKIRFLKEPPARQGFLEEKKFNELLALLPTHLRPLIMFLFWCAVRKGEALQIEWPQVDLDARLIRITPEQAKNKDGRTVPLPSVLITALVELNPKVGKVFDATNLRTEWERAANACGLGIRTKIEGEKNTYHVYTGLLVHDLRRSAVRNLRKAGVTEGVIMAISGHKTRAVFDRYNIVNTDDVLAAMRVRETTNLNPAIQANLVKKQPRGIRKFPQLVESK